MRLRILMVEGMPRPMVVIDDLHTIDQQQADMIKARVRDALPDYDVLLMSEVDLPQAQI